MYTLLKIFNSIIDYVRVRKLQKNVPSIITYTIIFAFIHLPFWVTLTGINLQQCHQQAEGEYLFPY